MKIRSGISPILATVILIAITLIAAVAIAGFVFGLFGSFTKSYVSSSIPYSVVQTNLPTSPTSNLTISCLAQSASYFIISNTGAGNGTVVKVTMNYNGTTYTAKINSISGCVSLPAGHDRAIWITSLPVKTYTGEKYTITISYSSNSYTDTFTTTGFFGLGNTKS